MKQILAALPAVLLLESVDASVGTRLIIEGYGFDNGGYDGTVEVRVGNAVCEVDEYQSSGTHLECITPASEYRTDTNAQVSVLVQSVNAVGYAESGAQAFQYKAAATPYLDSVTGGVFPGGQIRAEGLFRTDDKDYFDISLDGYQCEVADDFLGNIYLDYCTASDQTPVGKHTLNFKVNPVSPNAAGVYGFGVAGLADASAFLDVKTGETYTTIVYPKLTSLSTNVASLSAGQDLEISGLGFNSTKVDSSLIANATAEGLSLYPYTSVSIIANDGTQQDCPVKFVSTDKVICGPLPSSPSASVITNPAAVTAVGVVDESLNPFGISDSTNSFKAGGQGLNFRVFNTSQSGWPAIGTFTHLGGLRQVSASPDLLSNNTYFAQGLGIFTAPATTTYTFLCKGDDLVKFELSADTTVGNLKTVCSTSFYRHSYWQEVSQTSKAISLVKGEQYLFRLSLTEMTQDDWASIGVVVHNGFPDPTDDTTILPGLEGANWATQSEYFATKEVKQLSLTKDDESYEGCGMSFQILFQSTPVNPTAVINEFTADAISTAIAAIGLSAEIIDVGWADWETSLNGEDIGVAKYLMVFDTKEDGPSSRIPGWSINIINDVNCSISGREWQRENPRDIFFDSIPSDWVSSAVPSVASVVKVTVNGIDAIYTPAASALTAAEGNATASIFYLNTVDVEVVSSSISASTVISSSSSNSQSYTLNTAKLTAGTTVDDFHIRFPSVFTYPSTYIAPADLSSQKDELVESVLVQSYNAGVLSFSIGANVVSGNLPVTIIHNKVGASSPQQLTLVPTVTSSNAPSAPVSTAGGAIVTVTGANFGTISNSANTDGVWSTAAPVVTVGGVNAIVTSWSFTNVTFEVPALPVGSHAILVNGQAGPAASTTITTSDSVTATVTSVTPNKVPYGKSAFITLTGTLLNSGKSSYDISTDGEANAPTEVTVGGRSCIIDTINADGTSLVCLLRRSDVNTELASVGHIVTPTVRIQTGYASVDSSATVDMKFQITGLSTHTMSHAGGYLNVTGDGLTYSKTASQLNAIADVNFKTTYWFTAEYQAELVIPCSIVELPQLDENNLFSSFSCYLPGVCEYALANGAAVKTMSESAATDACALNKEVEGELVFTSNAYDASCDGDCSINLSYSATPVVTSLDTLVGTGGDNITFTVSNIPTTAAAASTQLVLGGRHDMSSLAVGKYTSAACSLASSTSQVTCTVPQGVPAGTYWARLDFGDASVGLANSTNSIVFTQEMMVTSVDNQIAAVTGLTSVTLTGYGFGTNSSALLVTVGGNVCAVESSTQTSITCRVPPASDISASSLANIQVSIPSIYNEDYLLSIGSSDAPSRRRRLCGVSHDASSAVATQGDQEGESSQVPMRASNRALLFPLQKAKVGSSASAISVKGVSASQLEDFKRTEQAWRRFARDQIEYKIETGGEEVDETHHVHDHSMSPSRMRDIEKEKMRSKDGQTLFSFGQGSDAETLTMRRKSQFAAEGVDYDTDAADVFVPYSAMSSDSSHAHHSKKIRDARRRLTSTLLAEADPAVTIQTRSVTLKNYKALEPIEFQRKENRRRLTGAVNHPTNAAATFTSGDCSTQIAYLKELQFPVTVTNMASDSSSFNIALSLPSSTPAISVGTCGGKFSLSLPTSYDIYIGTVKVETITSTAGIVTVKVPSSVPVGTHTIRLFSPSIGYFPVMWGAWEVTVAAPASVSFSSLSYAGGLFKASGIQLPAYTNPAVAAASNIVASNLYTTSSLNNLTSSYALNNLGSSYNGQLITQDPNAPVAVEVCGLSCPVISSDETGVSCMMPEFAVQSDVSSLINDGYLAINQTAIPYATPVTPKNTWEDQADAHWAFDGDVMTTSRVNYIGCFIGIDVGAGFLGTISRVDLYPLNGEVIRSALVGGHFDYSNDMSTWTTFASVQVKPLESWNQYELTSPVTARYFRFIPSTANSDKCNYVNEIRFIGVKVVDPAVYSANKGCSVNISMQQQDNGYVSGFNPTVSRALINTTAPLAQSVNYSKMPKVTSLSVVGGTSLGGTTTTIQGENLSTPSRASLAGSNVASVTSSSSTAVTVVTSPRSNIQMDTVILQTESSGFALVKSGVTYSYQDYWSNPRTWEDYNPPVEGDYVIIPFGQAIILDTQTPVLSTLLVQGDLIVQDKGAGADKVLLQATYFWMSGGEFHVGTEQAPYQGEFELIMHGDRYKTIELPYIIGAKVMVATPNVYTGRKGKLSIHGRSVDLTWTTLTVTANAGSTTLTLTDAVKDWRVGDMIVVTHKDNLYYAEEMQIAAIDSTFKVITLATPLAYDHVVKVANLASEVPSLSNPADSILSNLYLGCEVGLLTHNVKIRGDDNSVSQKFGIHTMAQHGAILQVEGAEFTWCGQQGIFGHYCAHFHLPGEMPTGYVRSNAVHHSFQRAVTIHGVHKATVEDNVAFDVCGHTIFVEDAIENYNVIQHNLVALTRKNHVLLPGDMKPANFWCPNPKNYYRHNVAAGSEHSGFWFEIPDYPTGPSYTDTVCPVNEVIGEFYMNRAHGSAVGIRVYPQWYPTSPPCSNNHVNPQWMNSTVAHDNFQGYFHKMVGDMHHDQSAFLDNTEVGAWVRNSFAYIQSPPNFQNSIFGNVDANATGRGIDLPQLEYWWLSNVTFYNIPSQAAMTTCFQCEIGEMYSQGGQTSRTSGLRFVNSPIKVNWSSPMKEIIWDMDGTVTGKGKEAWITYFYNHLDMPNICAMSDDALIYSDVGTECNRPVRKLGVLSVTPATFNNKVIRLRTSLTPNVESGYNGTTTPTKVYKTFEGDILFRSRGDFSGWTVPVISNTYVETSFTSLVSDPNFEQLQLIYSDPDYIFNRNNNSKSPEWLGITFNNTAYRNWFEVTTPLFNPNPDDGTVPDTASLPNLQVNALPWNSTLDASAEPDNSDALSLISGKEVTLPFASNVYSGPGQTGVFGLMLNTGSLQNRLAHEVGVSSIYKLKNPFMASVKARECPITGCYLPPAIVALDTPHKWSDAAGWAKYGKTIPKAGEDVTIDPSQYVYLDIDTPKLGVLTIEGKLEFGRTAFYTSSKKNLTLIANSIIVWGTLEIGNPNMPYSFDGVATIQLWGSEADRRDAVVEEGLFLGGKAITVVGTFTAIGTAVNAPWIPLNQTAHAGDQVIWFPGTVDQFGWNAGDELLFGGTSFDANNETERVTISKIETVTSSYVDIYGDTIVVNQVKISLAQPLNYTHLVISTPIPSTDDEYSTGSLAHTQVTVNALVGHLARSIIITTYEDRSTVVNQLNGNGWHLNVVAKKPVYQRAGTLLMRYVAMLNAGKTSTEFGALRFDFSAAASNDTFRQSYSQLFDSCVIDGLNIGIDSVWTPNVQIQNNVVANSVFYGIRFDGNSTAVNRGNGNKVRINNNLVMGVTRDLSWQMNWYIPFSGIATLGTPYEMKSNVVTGSDNIGFFIYAESCPGQDYASADASLVWPNSTDAEVDSLGNVITSSSSGPSVTGNTVVGAMIGIVHIPTNNQTCKAISGFSIFFASHIGILAIDEPNHVQYENNLVAESHIGISFNGLNSGNQVFAMINTVVAGNILPTNDTTICDLNNSNICHAVNMTDVFGLAPGVCNSAYGNAYRRVGITTAQQTDFAVTCYGNAGDLTDGMLTCDPIFKPERMCAMPWEGMLGVHGGVRNEIDMRQTTFMNFKSADNQCDNQTEVAVATDPAIVDYAGEFRFAKTRWLNVDVGTRVWLGRADCLRIGYDDQCDASSMLHGEDVDGTFIANYTKGGKLITKDRTGGSFVAKTSKFASDAKSCVSINEMDDIVYCPGEIMRAIFISNRDVDNDRAIGPFHINSSAPDASHSDIAYTTAGMQEMEECSLSKYIGNHIGGVFAGRSYKLMLSATNPSTTRFYYFGQPGEKVNFQLFYTQPNALQLFTTTDGGLTMVPGTPQNAPLPSPTSAHGSYFFDPQQRMLFFTLEGTASNANSNDNYVEIYSLPSVQISLTASVRVQDFVGASLAENIATLLGIDMKRVKVADPNFANNYAPTNNRRLAFITTPTQSYPTRRLQSSSSSTDLATTLNNNAPTSLPNEIANANNWTQLVAGNTTELDGTMLIYITPTDATIYTDRQSQFNQIASLASIASLAQQKAASGEFATSVAALPFIISTPTLNVYAPTMCGNMLKCNTLSVAPVSAHFSSSSTSSSANNTVSGTLNILVAPNNEVSVDGYKIYWGDANGTRLVGSAAVESPVADVLVMSSSSPATSTTQRSGSLYSINMGTNVAQLGQSFVVVPYNVLGLSSKSVYAPVSAAQAINIDPNGGSTNPTKPSASSSSSSLVAVLCAVIGGLVLAAGVSFFVYRKYHKKDAIENENIALAVAEGHQYGDEKFEIKSYADLKGIDETFSDTAKIHPVSFESFHSATAFEVEEAFHVVEAMRETSDPIIEPVAVEEDEAVRRLNDWLRQQRQVQESHTPRLGW